MDTKSEIREFVTSRRAGMTPDQVGLPVGGDNRRVPGLRQEKVALLARALQLDEAEQAHLFDLARATQATASTRGSRRRSSAYAQACSGSSMR